jgi:hypothetical protein
MNESAEREEEGQQSKTHVLLKTWWFLDFSHQMSLKIGQFRTYSDPNPNLNLNLTNKLARSLFAADDQ